MSARRRVSWLVLLPPATLLLFLLPIGAGLLFTLLPAFGYLPALGSEGFSLAPWHALFAAPELAASLRLTLGTGIAATLVSTGLAFGIVAAGEDRPWFGHLRRWLAPLLALPHVAIAIGFAFLIAPSGWIARLVAPLAGWALPPDLATQPDRYGIGLVLGLALKETPYLLLMILAAEPPLRPALAVGRSLGYGPFMAWTKLVLPRLYPAVRLPVLAVLAFSLSVVDVAMILAPSLPPPFAVLLLRWFNDPDLALRFQASAGAVLQLLLVAGAIGLWLAGERFLAIAFRPWLAAGRRGRRGALAQRLFETTLLLLLMFSAAAILAMGLWSVAASWRFPQLLPNGATLEHWRIGIAGLEAPILTTLLVGLASAALAALLAIGCLEQEERSGRPAGPRALWLLYLPLLVPQISFLFGLQILFLRVGLDGDWLGLVWGHLVFVLPYLFLSLADPYRALDRRYRRAALCLGASRRRVLFAVVLPLLGPSIAAAAAVGFAVSVGLYLPTLFVGAGRLPTLTTEAVGLAAGADRRVIGVVVMLQAALPLVAFAAALGWSRRPPGSGDRR